MKDLTSQLQKGFTLVELLIVVIILALLAAIVVPQFASSTDDAKEAALDTTLANVRSAIDLYYQQHGHYPSAVVSSGGACAGTAGTGAVDSDTAFLDQLAYYTNAAGQACTTKDDGVGDANAYPFGPYLKKRELSANPITNVSTLLIANAGDLNLNGTAADLGWRFDNLSGKFIANDTSNDPSGNPYDDR
ncbi:MAG: prepilin-type N-terminal cleavage/methylation domain-containing protein [Gammaproteobacteria bacterium]|nr:prepilin-type N-terminal cleavage/methylation domain-containing protein [Gammaproteobacteria bacterium]